VALLALHAQSLGLMSKPLDATAWLSHMSSAGLYDDHWLLAYEAYVKGWLPSRDGTDYIGADPAFDFMRANGVTFYDSTLALPTTPTSPIPVPQSPSTALAAGDADSLTDSEDYYV